MQFEVVAEHCLMFNLMHVMYLCEIGRFCWSHDTHCLVIRDISVQHFR